MMTNEDQYIDGYRTAIRDVRRATDDWLAAQPTYGADYSPHFVVGQLMAFVQRRLSHVAAGILVDSQGGDDCGLVDLVGPAREALERFDRELDEAVSTKRADYGRLVQSATPIARQLDTLLTHIEGTP